MSREQNVGQQLPHAQLPRPTEPQPARHSRVAATRTHRALIECLRNAYPTRRLLLRSGQGVLLLAGQHQQSEHGADRQRSGRFQSRQRATRRSAHRVRHVCGQHLLVAGLCRPTGRSNVEPQHVIYLKEFYFQFPGQEKLYSDFFFIFRERKSANDRSEKKHALTGEIGMLEFKCLLAMLATSIYSLNVFFQRQHLFVWSVYAPKLIYDLASLLVKFCLASFIFLSEDSDS